MELILCMIIGIIIGIVFGRQVFRRDVVGSLRVDQSDPDSGPYLFLELSHKGADASKSSLSLDRTPEETVQ